MGGGIRDWIAREGLDVQNFLFPEHRVNANDEVRIYNVYVAVVAAHADLLYVCVIALYSFQNNVDRMVGHIERVDVQDRVDVQNFLFSQHEVNADDGYRYAHCSHMQTLSMCVSSHSISFKIM